MSSVPSRQLNSVMHDIYGQNPISGYSGPACPTTTCGKCFKVCNASGYGGVFVGGAGICITVNYD
jgi:hypothetical protein